ncbi:MAG TPA: hypothetical protein VJN67_00090 [Stellaceae bacterium]|nr:hypothetical protein [Stellaceae bacterium]
MAIMGAGGGLGTSRAQYQSAVGLEMHVLMRSGIFVGNSSDKFGRDGDPTDTTAKALVGQLVANLRDTPYAHAA